MILYGKALGVSCLSITRAVTTKWLGAFETVAGGKNLYIIETHQESEEGCDHVDNLREAQGCRP